MTTKPIARKWWRACAVVALVWVGHAAPARANGARFTESWADPNDPKVVIAIFDSASPDGECLLRSADAGATWSVVRSKSGERLCRGGRGQVEEFFVRATGAGGERLLVVHAALGELAVAGADGKWKPIPSPDPNVEKLVPTSDPQRFFAIVVHQNPKNPMEPPRCSLAGTGDAGASWTVVTEQLPFCCRVLYDSCQADGSDDGRTLVVFEEGFHSHLSTDGGRTWRSVDEAEVRDTLRRIRAGRPSSPIRGTTAQLAAARKAIGGR